MSSRDEMALNATRWAQVAKRDLPKDLGFIFIFFPKDATGEGKGVVVGNVNNRALQDELKAVVRRHEDMRRIIVPGGD